MFVCFFVRNGESSVNEVSDGDEATAESVPLCLSDELERKTVKILTPRATSVYAPLPVSGICILHFQVTEQIIFCMTVSP